ncbi:MAG: DUF2141 domain-containing protein, partial [Bacteroidota bacterium]
MKKLLFVVLLLPFLGLSQNKLSIQVNKVNCSSGKVSVAIYNESEGFLKFEKVFKSNSVKANKGTTEVIIDDLPSGRYAVAVFHDVNGNDELDTNWMGIPKEDIAFSNAKMKLFGPPSFKECSFEVVSDKQIQLTL